MFSSGICDTGSGNFRIISLVLVQVQYAGQLTQIAMDVAKADTGDIVMRQVELAELVEVRQFFQARSSDAIRPKK